jgi:hypothetical protein
MMFRLTTSSAPLKITRRRNEKSIYFIVNTRTMLDGLMKVNWKIVNGTAERGEDRSSNEIMRQSHQKLLPIRPENEEKIIR